MGAERAAGRLSALLAMSCTGTTVIDPDVHDTDGSARVEERFTQPRAVPTDVVFLVDDRPVAIRMQAALSSRARTLVEAWVSQDADAHLAVVSASLQVPALFDDGDVTWAAAPGAAEALGDAMVRATADNFQHAARAMVKSVESGQSRPQADGHLHAIVLARDAAAVLPWRFSGTEPWETEAAFQAWLDDLVLEDRRVVWTTVSLPDCDDEDDFDTCLAPLAPDGLAAATDTRKRTWSLSERPDPDATSVTFRGREDGLWEGVSVARMGGTFTPEAMEEACQEAEFPLCFAYELVPDEGRLTLLTELPPPGNEIVVQYAILND